MKPCAWRGVVVDQPVHIRVLLCMLSVMLAQGPFQLDLLDPCIGAFVSDSNVGSATRALVTSAESVSQ